MGRNRIAKILTIVMLCVAGCAKPGFETSRKNLMRHQAQRSSRATLIDPEQPQILPSTHFAAGRMFEAQGHYVRAIEQYTKTIAVNHDHVAAHHRLGLIYSKLERHAEAIEMFRRAVALKPDNAVLHNNLGFELMFVKDWDGATRQLAEAIALEPNFARAHINMGMTLSKTERFDEALAHFRAVLPESDAQYNLGLMYRSARRYDDAAQSFRRVLATNPNFQAAQTQLVDIAPLLTPAANPEVDAATEVPAFADSRQDARDDMEPCPDESIEPDRQDAVVQQVRPEPTVVSPSTTRTIANDSTSEQTVAAIDPTPATEAPGRETTPRNEREKSMMIPPSTTRATVADHAEPRVVTTAEPPRPHAPVMVTPSTTRAIVVEAPVEARHEKTDHQLASLADDDWVMDEVFQEAVEIASVAEPFDLLDLLKPCEHEPILGTETASGVVVPTEGVVLPVPAEEVATPRAKVAAAEPLDAVPFGRLNDEVERIDDEIRCLIDEALEAFAVATPNASETVHIDPVFVEPMSETVLGDFVADSTEPIKHSPIVAVLSDVVTPTTDAYELRLPEDRDQVPSVAESSPIEKTVTVVETPTPERREVEHMPWRVRLSKLNANLVALRDEINCLEAADVNTTVVQERDTTPIITAKVDTRPAAEKLAKKTPRRVTPRTRSRSEDPKMMMAYNPTKALPILAASRPRSTTRRSRPTAHEAHDEPPTALARPEEASDVFAVVEIGPAFPAMQIGPAYAATERDDFNWDARFGDLHDLMSITENEIRCWEEAEEARTEEQVTDNSRSNQQRHKKRVTPVRFRPRRNPFYNK